MEKPPLLRAAIAGALLTTLAACATPAPPANAATAPLIDSQWRLTMLGGQPVVNPPGPGQIFLVLDSRNSAVTGASGCNRMFGRYALDGEALKFDAIGGTRMACLDQSRMDIKQRYLAMFADVARWKIRERELSLLDADGRALATFLISSN